MKENGTLGRWNTRKMNEEDRSLHMFGKAIGKVQYLDVAIAA